MQSHCHAARRCRDFRTEVQIYSNRTNHELASWEQDRRLGGDSSALARGASPSSPHAGIAPFCHAMGNPPCLILQFHLDAFCTRVRYCREPAGGWLIGSRPVLASWCHAQTAGLELVAWYACSSFYPTMVRILATVGGPFCIS